MKKGHNALETSKNIVDEWKKTVQGDRGK